MAKQTEQEQLILPTQDPLDLKIEKVSSHILNAQVIVKEDIIKKVVDHITTIYRKNLKPSGLALTQVPEQFVKDRYGARIEQTIKQFVLKHVVAEYLPKALGTKKILVVHQPRLVDIKKNDNDIMTYQFRISTYESMPPCEWRKLSFKPPKRKLYKDLDKQVEAFCAKEADLYKTNLKDVIQENDWVELEVQILDKTENPLFANEIEKYWFRFSERYLSSEFKQSLKGMKVAGSFITKDFPLHIQSELDGKAFYRVTVANIIKGSHFSLELFKSIFHLKNKTDIHRKLIEVFSFRNDISQRKSIVEELFNLLLTKQRFEIPHHLTLRKQEELLESIKKLPDFHVYKAHKNFQQHLSRLAEKQLKEEILIDSIAHKEGTSLTKNDIPAYLHLFNHERLKEFVYFKPRIEQFEDLDAPIPENILAEAVLREKVLNTIIHYLSKN